MTRACDAKRGEIQVAERLRDRHGVGHSDAGRLQHGPGARVCREDDGLAEPAERLDDRAQTLQRDVRLAVDRGDHVGGLAPGAEPRERIRPSRGDRCKAEASHRASRRRPLPPGRRLPRGRGSRRSARRGTAAAVQAGRSPPGCAPQASTKSPLRSPASTCATETPSALRGAGARQGLSSYRRRPALRPAPRRATTVLERRLPTGRALVAREGRRCRAGTPGCASPSSSKKISESSRS